MKKMSKAEFMSSLAYATRQAHLNRYVGRALRWAIEDRAQLPLPKIKDLNNIQSPDQELVDDPIYKAVAKGSDSSHVHDVYELFALAEAAWEHYEEWWKKERGRRDAVASQFLPEIIPTPGK